MYKNILLVYPLIMLVACNNRGTENKKLNAASSTAVTADLNNRLTEDEKKEGWELLFDGVSTKGWHKYGNSPVGAAWKVVDGNLYLDAANKVVDWLTRDGGDIVTDKEYDNFYLKYEWKIDTNGNSGVFFYVHEDSTKYKFSSETGPEMQIMDHAGHPEEKLFRHYPGDLYDLISCSKETAKPALQWNIAEIRCVNGKLDFYQNGENVLSTTMWDDNWKKIIAGSKFKDMPGFGVYQKGRIALQDHGSYVWFRNIKIRQM